MKAGPDFRSRRFKLPKEAFAIAPEIEPRPTDRILEEVWGSIVTLPDDVSIRTTDFHGSTLKDAHETWEHWITLLLDLQSLTPAPSEDGLCLATMILTDELQASTYACLTGFYRQAIAGLRLGIEAVAAGTYFRAAPNAAKYALWADGLKEGQLWMRDIRNELAHVPPYSKFEGGAGKDTLLGKEGWLNFLYGRLSAFSHGRPFFSTDEGDVVPTCNVGLWDGSNGPVYERRSVRLWSVFYADVALCCLLLVGLAEPRIVNLERRNGIAFGDFVNLAAAKSVALHPVVAKICEHLLLTGPPQDA